jgi:hypothetical protein
MANIHENHTYKIVNVKSGTVLDLSGTDHHTSTYISFPSNIFMFFS